MNWIDKIYAAISPQTALRRIQARTALRAWSEYESVTPSRIRRDKKSRKSADAENERSAIALRSLARNMEQNFDIASGVLDTLIANVIGTGIRPEPLVQTVDGEPAEELNRKLIQLFDDWIHLPEVTREFDYYSFQRIMARSAFRDGDVFGQMLVGPVALLDHGTIVPYSLEGLEADFVPNDYNALSRNIIQGVELNTWGRARAYMVYKRHPGDAMNFSTDLKRVPAERMFHLKTVKRLHQTRGISVFASTLARFDDIKEIDESERVAARVAAAMAGYIKKGIPDTYTPQVDPDTGDVVQRSMEFVPGIIFDDLLPGEDIGTINTNRPNNELIPFRDSQLRAAAAGAMAGYSSISKNYGGTYSAQRQELVEQFVHYRMLTGTFTFKFCQRVWDNFIDAARLSGAVEFGRNIDFATIYDASHSAPPMPWIDPKKEMEANKTAEEMQWKSRPGIIRERGGNPDQINREILQDKRERERMGIKSETAAPAANTVPDDSGNSPDNSTNQPAAVDRFQVVTKRGSKK